MRIDIDGEPPPTRWLRHWFRLTLVTLICAFVAVGAVLMRVKVAVAPGDARVTGVRA